MDPNAWYNFGGQNPHYPPYQQAVHQQAHQQAVHQQAVPVPVPVPVPAPEYTQHEFAAVANGAEPTFSPPAWAYDNSHQHPHAQVHHQPQHQPQAQPQSQLHQPQHQPQPQHQHQHQHQHQLPGEHTFVHHGAHNSNYGQFGEVQQHPYANAAFTYQPHQVGNQFSVGFPGHHQSPYQGHVTPDPAPTYFQPPPQPAPTYHQPPAIAPQTSAPIRAPVRAPASAPSSTPTIAPARGLTATPTRVATVAPKPVPKPVQTVASTAAPTAAAIDAPTNNTHPGQNVSTFPQARQVDGPIIGNPPVGSQWKSLEGLPNAFVSDVPVPELYAQPNEMKYYGKRTWTTLRPNQLRTKLVPGRSTRLPGEIKRDIKAAESLRNSPNFNDNIKAQLETQLQVLRSEFLAVSGESLELKGDAKGKTKVAIDDFSDASDEEDDIDRRAREIKSAVLSPEDTVKVVEQKAVKIVWQDPADPPQQNAIAVAISEYGSLIEELWAKHKALNKDYKDAVAEGKDVQAKALQNALKRQTELIYVAVEATNKYGADTILENMGKNQKLTIILLNFVRYCYTAKDYKGPAPKSVLYLISEFTTLGTEFLGRLKLEQLRTKYQKDIDTESRQYLKQIFDNAKECDKQRSQASTVAQDSKKAPKVSTTTPTLATKEISSLPKSQVTKKDLASKSTATDLKRMQPIKYAGLESARKVANGVSTKRPRDDDFDARSSKKVAVEGNTGTPAANKQSSAAPASSSANQSGTVTTATAQTRPKSSASILPGKSRPVVKPVAKKPESQPQRSVFGSLLEEIAKPKESPKPREEPEGRPETEEEKTRRLRKESRRGRRVTWASEDQLVHYRFFQHDSAEDEGRARNQLRDARDNRSEGQMLKLLTRGKKDKEDGEESEEDDDEDVKEITLTKWHDLTVSARSLSQERAAKNFERRAGSQKPDSAQRKFINEYESRELMSIYTTKSEIPESPRSPPHKAVAEPLSQPSVAPTPPNNPRAHETYRRASESRQFGSIGATQQAIGRLSVTASFNSTRKSNSSDAQSSPRMMTQEQRDAEVLNLLKSDRVTKWLDQSPYDPTNPKTQRRYDYPDQKTQEAADSIESLVEEFKDKPFPPTEPPKWLQDNPDRVKEWWAGHSANAAKVLTVNAPAAYPQAPTPQQLPQQDANPYAKMLQQVQAIQANQTNLPTQQQTATQPQMSAGADIQTLLRTLSQPTAVTQPQVPAATQLATSNTDANAAAWMAYYAQLQNHGQTAYQQQPAAATATSPDATAAQWAAYYQQYQNQAQGQQQTSTTPYGQERQNDGDQARRDRDRDRDRRNNNNNRGHGTTGRGGGDRDSRGINRSLIGTKPCTFWAKDQCTKGDKCTFRHDPADLVSSNY